MQGQIACKRSQPHKRARERERAVEMQLQDAVNHGNTFLEEANKFEAENKKLKAENKQAKIDVLNELKEKIQNEKLNDDTAQIIIDMIEELEK